MPHHPCPGQLFRPCASVVCVVPLRRGLPGVFPHIPPTFAQILWRDAGGFVAILDALRAFLPAIWMPNPSGAHSWPLVLFPGTWCALGCLRVICRVIAPSWCRFRVIPAFPWANATRIPWVAPLSRPAHRHGKKNAPVSGGLTYIGGICFRSYFSMLLGCKILIWIISWFGSNITRFSSSS